MAAPSSPWKTQADQAFDLIRSEILSCRFRPGAKLKTNRLCADYNLSLGPVREALSRLGADGLVVAQPHKGFSVAPISRADLVDLGKARAQIEALCLADAIRNGDLRWRSEILVALRALEDASGDAAAQAGDATMAQICHLARFHLTLIAACSNRWLLQIRKTLVIQSDRYNRLLVMLGGPVPDIGTQHRALFEATIERDIARAQGLIAEYLERMTAAVLEGLDTILADDGTWRCSSRHARVWRGFASCPPDATAPTPLGCIRETGQGPTARERYTG